MTTYDVPLVTAADLGLILNDPTINVERIEMMIEDATLLCLSVIDPLPDSASVVIKRMAARAYVDTVTTRGAQMTAAGSPFGGSGGYMSGVILTRLDRSDLRRLNGGSNAFTINPLGPDYVMPDMPPWDVNGGLPDIATS